jgi:hypothetical protein
MEEGELLHAAEIKSGKTVMPDAFTALRYFHDIASTAGGSLSLVYGGDSRQDRSEVRVIPWIEAGIFFSKESNSKQK